MGNRIKKFFIFAVMPMVLSLAFASLTPSAANAFSWSCTQYSTAMAVALGNGDVAAAANARTDMKNCSFGIGHAIAGSVAACSTYNNYAISAYSRGETGRASIWNAAYTDCVANTKNYLASLSAGTTTGKNTSSNTGTNTSLPAGPTCSGAPNMPGVTYKWTTTGIRITVSPDLTGQQVVDLQYTIAYFNGTTSTWLPWSTWTGISAATPTSFDYAPPSPDITKIGFVAIQRNSCAVSANARADQDKTGLKIFNPPLDEISQVITSVPVGVSLNASQIVSTISGKAPSIEVLTPKVCALVGGSLTAKAAGNCTLSVRSAGTDALQAKNSTLTLKMVAPTKTITCYKKGNSKVTKKVNAVAPKCPTGYSTKK